MSVSPGHYKSQANHFGRLVYPAARLDPAKRATPSTVCVAIMGTLPDGRENVRCAISKPSQSPSPPKSFTTQQISMPRTRLEKSNSRPMILPARNQASQRHHEHEAAEVDGLREGDLGSKPSSQRTLGSASFGPAKTGLKSQPHWTDLDQSRPPSRPPCPARHARQM